MTYAKGTSVSVEKSRAEIETILERYGAQAFAYMRTETRAAIEFAVRDRRVRFVLPLPNKTDKKFTHDHRRGVMQYTLRSDSAALAAWDQACRERWRALALAIKAKLEAVESQISHFEEEFMAHIVDPYSNKTVGELMLPQIARNYEGIETNQLLLAAPQVS